MGALSNDASQLAHLVGFYKAIQSAGAAGIYRMDSQLVPFMTELATSWGLAAAGIVFVVPVIWLRVKDREFGLWMYNGASKADIGSLCHRH